MYSFEALASFPSRVQFYSLSGVCKKFWSGAYIDSW